MKTESKMHSGWDLQAFQQMHLSFAPARILSAALQLQVFSHIAAGSRTAAAIARAAGASERGMTMLLDALTALELLEKKNGEYILLKFSRQYLVRDSPEYVGSIMENDALWNAWSQLTECVRTGKPFMQVNQQNHAEAFFPVLIRTLHITGRQSARRLAQALGAGAEHRGLRVLDVGCGSGVWGIAMAEADAAARLTAQDFPAVLDHTRRFLEQHGVADRYDFLPGDLNQVAYGQARYDLALLGNIVHSEGESASRALFRNLHAALRPGGRVVVIDMIPNDGRTGPFFPLMFALNMLVNTNAGSVYTLAEYSQWLRDAGFDRIETLDIASHSPAIVAAKA